MIPYRTRTIAAVAVALWPVTTVVLLTGHWSLSCTLDGNDAGGIDCFQENTMPHAGSAPASWFGFVPLGLLWLALTGVLVWFAPAARRHR